MREEHDETPFPCSNTGCKRVKARGFVRKRDLIKHMKREHDTSADDELEIEEMKFPRVSPNFDMTHV